MAKRIDSVLNTKSYAFAIRIVKLSQFLQKEKAEYVLNTYGKNTLASNFAKDVLKEIV